MAAEHALKKFFPLIPVLVALAVFSVALNNFFTYDDFIWLYRGKTLWKNWGQMFYPDVIYFDPVVYLMFLADYLVAGVNHTWYQAVDLAIHALNAFLVYRLACRLSGDEKAALYASVVFASSSVIADAVLWPSSRVDLVSVTFCLGVLIQFLQYLRTDNRRFLWASWLLFVLALAAKGTPAVLPVVLGWLIVQEGKPVRHAACMVPFAAVIALYAVVLKLSMHHASLPLDRLHLNTGNLVLSFCALFIPEATLKFLNLPATALVLFLVAAALALYGGAFQATLNLRRTGFFFLLAAILPVLAVTDFKLLSEYSNPYLVLLSPSHRLYLASVGSALLIGGALRAFESGLARYAPGPAAVGVGALMALLVLVNVREVRARDRIWQSAADWAQSCFNGLSAYRKQVAEGSQVGLVNFPGSRGFTTPMVKLALDVDDVTLMKEVETALTRDPAVLEKAERTHLFVLGGDGKVHDKSPLYRQQLLENRRALSNPGNPQYLAQFQQQSARLVSEINTLLQ